MHVWDLYGVSGRTSELSGFGAHHALIRAFILTLTELQLAAQLQHYGQSSG